MDLFEQHDRLPKDLQELIPILNEAVENGHQIAVGIIRDLFNRQGYDFEIDADGTPINLRLTTGDYKNK